MVIALTQYSDFVNSSFPLYSPALYCYLFVIVIFSTLLYIFVPTCNIEKENREWRSSKLYPHFQIAKLMISRQVSTSYRSVVECKAELLFYRGSEVGAKADPYSCWRLSGMMMILHLCSVVQLFSCIIHIIIFIIGWHYVMGLGGELVIVAVSDHLWPVAWCVQLYSLAISTSYCHIGGVAYNVRDCGLGGKLVVGLLLTRKASICFPPSSGL